jgi:hypothetical protein
LQHDVARGGPMDGFMPCLGKRLLTPNVRTST